MTSILSNVFWAIFSAVCGVILAKILERMERKHRYIVYWIKTERTDKTNLDYVSEDGAMANHYRTRIIIQSFSDKKITEDDISQADPLIVFVSDGESDDYSSKVTSKNLAVIEKKINIGLGIGSKNPNGFKLEAIDGALKIHFQYWLKGQAIIFYINDEDLHSVGDKSIRSNIKLSGTFIEGEVLSGRELRDIYQKRYSIIRPLLSLLTIVLMMTLATIGHRENAELERLLALLLPGTLIVTVWSNIYYNSLIRMTKNY